MSHVIPPIVFDQSLRRLHFDVQTAQVTHFDPEAVALAAEMLAYGQILEEKLLNRLIGQPFNNTIERDFIQPVDYTHPYSIGQGWSDPEDKPLKSGEAWNYFNRASNTGIYYALDEQARPVNPFFNYGIKGRGVIGRYGPNHAVDMAPCRIMRNQQGERSLHVLGIIRGDSGLPSLCGGFTNFVRNAHGLYPYNKHVQFQSQAREFFEEMISGSVALLPEYAKGLDQEIDFAIKQREMIQKEMLSPQQKSILTQEMTTHRKVRQVEKEDPEFLKNIYDCFARSKECYAGPVLSSMRNTNTSWMETKLSWFMLDEKKWDSVKGDNKFHYDFSAGDDAQTVLWHEITPELLANSGIHGPLFCYVLSSCLAASQQETPEIVAILKNQAKSVLYPQAKPILTPIPLKL